LHRYGKRERVLCRTIAQAVIRRLLTAELWVRSHCRLCGIYGGQSGAGKCFYPCFLKFSPVNTIASLLHTLVSPGGVDNAPVKRLISVDAYPHPIATVTMTGY
jgi:hypothetical protein